jgi:protein ImuB
LGTAAPPAEAPLVLVGHEGRRRVVLAADAAAHRAGLRIGMPAIKAQALVPGLIIKDADPAADAEALDRLAAVGAAICADRCGRSAGRAGD